MKNILLASTAIVAFAGAAYAEGHTGVSFSGDAEIGYNDDFDDGMFWSFGLGVTGTMELDNGLTASISGDIDIDDSAETYGSRDIEMSDLVISLSSDMASLTFGDTAPAADALYSSAVTNMDGDGFNEAEDNGEDGVLIGRMSFGEAEVGISYSVFNSNGAVNDDIAGLQVGANASFGTVDLTFGYQDADNFDGEIVALGASTTLGGATVGLGYSSTDGGTDSIGIQAAYTFGAVTATAFYVAQDPVDDNYGIALDYESGPITVGALLHDGNDEDMQINATYDMGNGLNLFAGYRDQKGLADGDAFYVGGDYDLGGGANLRVSYAEAGSGYTGDDLEELGAAEDVKVGTTVALSLAF